MISSSLMRQKIIDGEIDIAPLNLSITKSGDSESDHKEIANQIIVLIRYGRGVLEAQIEMSTRIAPSIIERVVRNIKSKNKESGKTNPLSLLYVPFLSEDLVKMLNEEKISAIDMNGNYLIQTEKFIAIRLDKKNRFKEESRIKSVYSRNSSIMGRYLLSNKVVPRNLSEIQKELQESQFNLSLGTISKILKQMEEDLIIIKEKNTINLIQPAGLLSKLEKGYIAPVILKSVFLKLPTDTNYVMGILTKAFGRNNWIYTGESSAGRYATTTPSNKKFLYVFGNEGVANGLRDYINDKFYNYVLHYTNDRYIFYDAKENYASSLQSYLELKFLDKREREIAEDVKKILIDSQNG